jgi:hypothetical protein
VLYCGRLHPFRQQRPTGNSSRFTKASADFAWELPESHLILIGGGSFSATGGRDEFWKFGSFVDKGLGSIKGRSVRGLGRKRL